MPKNETHNRKAHHHYETKNKMIIRMKRIEGQIRGISRMIEEDVYCDDILHQFMSVESAIKGVKKSLLEAHINGCIVHQIKDGKTEVVDELINTISKMIK